MSDNWNAVICNICGLPYSLPEDEVVGNVPHVLLCSHIFCTACLRSLESPQNVISCPECKMDTSVCEDGVEGLQVDSRIIGLIYTAKMNMMMKKSRGGDRDRDRQRTRRHKSPSAPLPVVHTHTELGPDSEKALDDALSQAVENLTQLESLQQTLASGLQVQVRKEKNRLQKEIDEATDRAISVLQKRKSVLLSELWLEQCFTRSRMECDRVDERRRSLQTTIQQARNIRKVPSLEDYVELDKLLETLQTPVDVQSYDLSCLSRGSGLSCYLQSDDLERLKSCLKIRIGNVKILSEEPTPSRPAQQGSYRRAWRGGGVSGEWRAGRHGSREPCSPQRPQENLGIWPTAGPTPTDASPNVIIEEIIEDSETVFSLPAPEPRQNERQWTPQRRNRRPLLDKPSVRQGRMFQEWVVVTHVINPTHFYVRHMAEHRAWVQLAKKINQLCSGERGQFTPNDQLKQGSLMFVKWKEDMWCRTVVCELFQRGHLECVTHCPALEVARLRVFFQDYGYTQGFTLSGDRGVADLNDRFRRADVAVLSEMGRWAPQAIKCSLKDIIPADLVKGWSSEARVEFERVIGQSAVEMQVFGQERDALLVDLKKAPMDLNASDMPLSLREYMVFMELARFYSPVAVPGGTKPLQFYPPVYPKAHVELNAVVSHINTPAHFYIQLVDNMEFLLLNSKLQDCYGTGLSERERDGLQVYCPVLDQACVALYDDKVWYRAQITGFPGGRLVEVQFVDFGNRKALSVNDLRQIKDEFFALPAMAVLCCLADVVSGGESWSDESIQKFRNLTEQKLVTAVATKFVPRGVAVPVRLYEVNESSEPSASIAELLVREELASFSKGAQPKEPPVPDVAVWDPPFEASEGPSGGGAPSAEPSELHPSLTLPASLKDLRVRVTHVQSPGNFCVQLLQADTQLKRAHELLKKEYSKSEVQEVEWRAEMFCAANVNGVWERGQVCGVSSSNVAEVLRCDFGNKVKLHLNNLRPLLPDLIGSLLLECCLSDIRPAGGRSTWTATACDFISYYLTGATAIMTIKDPPPAQPVAVSLFCSNRAGQDVSIADFLISEGLALRERKPRVSPEETVPLLEEALPVSEVSAVMSDGSAEVDQRSAVSMTEAGVNPLTPPPPSVPPQPAPRITPPPERVRTQAYPPPEMPNCGHTHLRISAVSDQGVIYAITPHAECEFERLQERLQQHIKSLPRQKHYNWRGVLGCAVMGSDMLWYRGQVLEVIGGHVKVRYVDQGLVENIPVCHVYPMVLCEDMPQLCVPCQLNGVIPVGKVWQWDAVALMKELLLGRCVNVQVMDLPADPRGCVTVEIILDGMPLSRIMVHHQHATVDTAAANQEEYVVKPPVPDLDDWDLNIVGLDEPQPVLRVYMDPCLPDKGKHFRVRIKHVRTPNEVFLCLLENASREQEGEESLEEALRRANEEVDTLPHLTDFPIEGPCLAEYSDGKYYRAKLLGFSGLNPTVRVLVRHVDFGSDDILPTHKLRSLPVCLLEFPCEAVCVRLAGFAPASACVERERVPYRPEWSMKALLEMIDLLHGNVSAVGTTAETLTVFLYNADGSLVHLPLVEKGLADYE